LIDGWGEERGGELIKRGSRQQELP